MTGISGLYQNTRGARIARGETTENYTDGHIKGQMIPRGDKIRAMDDDDLAWVIQEFRVDALGKGRGDHTGYLPDSKKAICDWLKELVEA